MAKFNLAVVETLSRSIEVDANTLEEAIEIAHSMYNREEIVIDESDFVCYDIISLY